MKNGNCCARLPVRTMFFMGSELASIDVAEEGKGVLGPAVELPPLDGGTL